ncbi:MAG: hypothetical protein IT306_12340 [Chloroflexi bacterium]|nr:hypothetical protein [Chloroflexota bacterium]
MRRFYRIARDNPPTAWDFTSNEVKGRQPRRPLLPSQRRLWRGLSHFDTLDAARAAALNTPALGKYVVEVDIPDDADVEIEQTGRPGHFTIWASPVQLLRCLGRVVPVAE